MILDIFEKQYIIYSKHGYSFINENLYNIINGLKDSFGTRIEIEVRNRVVSGNYTNEWKELISYFVEKDFSNIIYDFLNLYNAHDKFIRFYIAYATDDELTMFKLKYL